MLARFASLLLLLLLAACATNTTLVLDGSYPTPIARKLPLTVGVYYPPQLRNHVFIELDESKENGALMIQSGASQLQLFNTVLPALFKNVVMLDSPEQAATQTNLDAVLIPTLAEFQLGLPQKTRMKVYEVWLKYNLRLTRPDGQQIADWVMTAYGKASEEDTGLERGVKTAATVAMRDLAANFTLGFAKVPGVKDWLQNDHHLP